MSSYLVWKYAHILMFVFWVGTDMGVFLAAQRCTDPKLSFASRVTLLHMALRIELLPRTMWKAVVRGRRKRDRSGSGSPMFQNRRLAIS